LRVLIIDRVSVFQKVITNLLESSGIDCVCCTTGRESIELLNELSLDCICMSLYLDDTDAFSLTQKIRRLKKCNFIPIAMITSETQEHIYDKAIQSGITDVFAKNKLVELVNFLLRLTQIDSPIAGNGKVLYIEDQASQRALVEQIFRNRALEVDAFSSAEDAWQAFLSHRYQLVVTDINLGKGMSGGSLINKIRRLEGPKGDIPILAITAYDDASRRINLYHLGISDYVIKPVIEGELIARVRNLIKHQFVVERDLEFSALLRSDDTIQHAHKMEALGALSSGIAHDYNNMLGLTLGYIDLMKMEMEDQTALQTYIAQIEKATNSGVRLTKKLLSFARKEQPKIELVNIDEQLIEVTPILQKLLIPMCTICVETNAGSWRSFIDPHEFENALLNLSINAKHAMDAGGTLTLTTNNHYMNRLEAEALELPAGEYICVTVRDTGRGMDVETASSIFNPFFTTKGEDGTGLGLSQVYGFMQSINGAITVVSELGKGTEFRLCFPGIKDKEAPPSKTAITQECPSTKQ
jgi:DNA-binding response OmpR family regulator